MVALATVRAPPQPRAFSKDLRDACLHVFPSLFGGDPNGWHGDVLRRGKDSTKLSGTPRESSAGPVNGDKEDVPGPGWA